MEKKDFIILVVGILLFVLLFIILVIVVSRPSGRFLLPEQFDSSSCPDDYSQLPVILISLDGFRPDYLERGVTPTLKQMKEKGVSSPYMIPVFPSLTFPNHYSIVTGLYPEWHGIISNSFYDRRYRTMFSYKTEESRKGRWWGGEPIWNTANKSNLKSGTYFWVGSEAPINGYHPTYWFRYNSSIPLPQRPAQVLEWLKLPPSERPAWISLYANQPDKAGHTYGPGSDELTAQLGKVDEMVTILLEGLEKKNLLSCVNILIVSDHGMAPTGEKKVIHLDKFMPQDLWDKVYFGPGATGRMSLKSSYKDRRKELEDSLSCKKNFKMFRREELPKRLHYSKDRRVGEYVFLLEDEFSVNLNSSFFLKGIHGYDNYIPSMKALFLAYGPGFKKNFQVEPFENIELYNLMCRLLNIPPAPNNGTWGFLDKILKNPPASPALPKKYDAAPIIRLEEESEWRRNYNSSNCFKNDNAVELSAKLLDIREEHMAWLEKTLCPWGIPRSEKSSANFTVLFHPDHVTGYSSRLKIPLWTSFEVSKAPSVKTESHWFSDVRLDENNSLTCDEFELMTSHGRDWKMAPLFPAEFSLSNTTKFLSYLISNAVLFTKQFQHNWDNLMLILIPEWLQSSKSSLNVVVGPVFDNDFDGLIDDTISIDKEPPLPTDYFAIVTRCKKEIQNLHDCSEEDIDSLAFIYPQNLTLEMCWEGNKKFAHMYRAKIQDVELSTGINFFSNITFQQKMTLATNQVYELW